MSSSSQGTGISPETTNLVVELISSLESAFRLVDFERVTKIIVAREENLKRELKEKERRIEWLETERLEKIQEEADLREKLDSYAKRLEGFLKKEVELNAMIRDLEVAKLNAVKEVEVYKSRFSVLEIQLEGLERDFKSVSTRIPTPEHRVKPGFVDVEEKGGGLKMNWEPIEDDVSIENNNVDEQCSVDGEMRIGGEGNVGSRMDMGEASDDTAQVGLDGSLGNANCRTNGSGSLMRNGGKMRIDGEGNVGSRTNRCKASEKIVKAAVVLVDACENAHLKANAVGSFMGNAGKRVEDCGRPLPETFVEIVDSDEESTPRESRNIAGKKSSFLGDSMHSSNKGSSGPLRMNNLDELAAEEVVTGLLKRKQPSFSDVGGSNNCNNDEINQGREKLMKVDHCAATTTKSMDGGMTQFASRLDVEHDSDDTSSSSSEGLDVLAFMPISSLDRKAMSGCKHEKWEFEADMNAAIEKDGLLCLKAICALYRCQALKKIDKVDSSRIETLANFLIGGHPQEKLTKTVEDLQNYQPNGIDECRRLAIRYSLQLFRLYKRHGDSIFWS